MSTTYISSKKETDPSEVPSESQADRRVVYQYKVILLGDIAVGKSAILRRFTDNEFSKEYVCTVGVEYRIKPIVIDNKVWADLKIWDTCGEEKYRTITRQYYRDSKGVLLVFDLTSLISFEKLQEWYDDVMNCGPKDMIIGLAGNKKDLPEREVTEGMIKEFLNEHPEIEYTETSALTGEGVTEAFKKLAEKLVKLSIDKENKKVEAKDEEEEPDFTVTNTIKLPDVKVKANKNINDKKKCC